jgi:hypothetical protein
MSTAAVEVRDAARGSEWMIWAGWLLSALAASVFIWSAYMKLTQQPGYVTEMERLGYSPDVLTGLALLQSSCLALYLYPRTAVLGVVLLTGYLGGAIASYVRLGDNAVVFANIFQVSTALLLWGGLYLREERLWSLLPLRRGRVR